MSTQTDRTTITVDTATRNDLFDRKEPTDSYDDVIRRLLDAVDDTTQT
jgi:predicted CopG family antitoxin